MVSDDIKFRSMHLFINEGYYKFIKFLTLFILCGCLAKSIYKLYETINEEVSDVTKIRIHYWGLLIFNQIKNLPIQFIGPTLHEHNVRNTRIWSEYFIITAGSFWLLPQISLINLILATIDKAQTNGRINSFEDIDFIYHYIPVFFSCLFFLHWSYFIGKSMYYRKQLKDMYGQKAYDLMVDKFKKLRSIKLHSLENIREDAFRIKDISLCVFCLFAVIIFLVNTFIIAYLINYSEGKLHKKRLNVLKKDFLIFSIVNLLINTLFLIYCGYFFVGLIYNKINGDSKNKKFREIYNFDLSLQEFKNCSKYGDAYFEKYKEKKYMSMEEILINWLSNLLLTINFSWNAPGRHKTRKKGSK